MDGERFDDLLRWLTGNATRRAVTRIMAAITLVTPLDVWLSPDDIEARKKRKKKKKKCKGGKKKCGKTCIPATACCNGVCGSGQQCCNGSCLSSGECCGGCGSGLACCAGTCVNLANNSDHCGGCGSACISDVCVHGACTCPEDPSQCPDGCLCSPTRDGQSACIGDPGSVSCSTNDDCPVGSVCYYAGNFNFYCSTPCLG